jgi:hypothetical protein
MYHTAFHFQIAVNGQSFNRSARDAWELFQSTGVEALIAYDCSGAVLLMSTILGGLITGTCTGVWTYYTQIDKAIIVGSTSMLIGMILVSAYMCIKFSLKYFRNRNLPGSCVPSCTRNS